MISFSAPNVINIFIFLDHLPFLRLVMPVLFSLGDQYAKSLFIVLSKACIHVLICHLLRLVSLFVKFFPILFSSWQSSLFLLNLLIISFLHHSLLFDDTTLVNIFTLLIFYDYVLGYWNLLVDLVLDIDVLLLITGFFNLFHILTALPYDRKIGSCFTQMLHKFVSRRIFADLFSLWWLNLSCIWRSSCLFLC